MKPTARDLKRLRKMADKLDRDEAYFQKIHGDPLVGSVRLDWIANSEALRRVIAFVSEGSK